MSIEAVAGLAKKDKSYLSGLERGECGFTFDLSVFRSRDWEAPVRFDRGSGMSRADRDRDDHLLRAPASADRLAR